MSESSERIEELDVDQVENRGDIDVEEIEDDDVDLESGDDVEDEDDEESDNKEPGDPLDEEGDIAADYLEELLDIADLDGDIDTYVESGRAHVSIVTDSQTLVGKEGPGGPAGAVPPGRHDRGRASLPPHARHRRVPGVASQGAGGPGN